MFSLSLMATAAKERLFLAILEQYPTESTK